MLFHCYFVAKFALAKYKPWPGANKKSLCEMKADSSNREKNIKHLTRDPQPHGIDPRGERRPTCCAVGNVPMYWKMGETVTVILTTVPCK